MPFQLLSMTDSFIRTSLLDRSNSVYTLDLKNQVARQRDEAFSIGSRSSYERSDRMGDRQGRDFYQFKLSRSSRVRIGVTNREFLFGPSLEIRLEKRGNSGKIAVRLCHWERL